MLSRIITSPDVVEEVELPLDGPVLTRRVRRPASRQPPLDQLTIALPALLAMALCAIELSTRSLWLDEGATVGIATQHGAALWHGIARDGGNMLAYYLLIHTLIGVFGDGLVVLRLPSLIASGATAAIVSALGLRLFPDRRRIALSAGVLAAVSLPLVYWGQNARGYAFMITLGAASFLSLTAILQTPAGARPSRGAVVAYGLTTLAAMYVGFFSILLVAAQLVLVLAGFRARARVVIGTLAAVAVLCVPLAVLAVERGSKQLFWVSNLHVAMLAQAATTMTSGGFAPDFHRTPTTTAAAALTVLLLIAVLAAALRLWSRRSLPARERLGLSLLAAWLLIPSALAVGAGLAGEPVEYSRASVLMLPAVALLLGWGLAHPGLPRGAGLATLGVVLALRAMQLVPSYGTSPENWHGVTNYLVAASHSSRGCVAFYPEDGRTPFDYYLPAAAKTAAASLTPVLPTTPWSQTHSYVEDYAPLRARRLAGVTSRCQRVWLVASHTGDKVGPPLSERNYRGFERIRRQLHRAYGPGRLHVFGYSPEEEVYSFVRGRALAAAK